MVDVVVKFGRYCRTIMQSQSSGTLWTHIGRVIEGRGRRARRPGSRMARSGHCVERRVCFDSKVPVTLIQQYPGLRRACPRLNSARLFICRYMKFIRGVNNAAPSGVYVMVYLAPAGDLCSIAQPCSAKPSCRDEATLIPITFHKQV
jgi:hypothetical protein